MASIINPPYNDTNISSKISLNARRPRKIYSKLFASASSIQQLKVISVGDSLANLKLQHLMATIDRKFGGTNANGVNTAGNISGAGLSSGGIDANFSGGTYATETSQFQYWLTGVVVRIDVGNSTSLVVNGVAPTFNEIKIFYITEPGAGTLNLIVGGTTVSSVSANQSNGVGILTYTKAIGQSTTTVSVTGSGSVRILFCHVKNTLVSGLDFYNSFSIGGLLLSTALAQSQCRSNVATVMTSISPDLVTFEMDDDFGDSSSNDVAFTQYLSILDTNCLYSDKLIIGSTPRASNDVGKFTANEYLRVTTNNKNSSYLYFNSYTLLGTYAEMNAIFGTDDGVHPTASANAFAAEILYDFLGFNSTTLGYSTRAVNDPGTVSKLAKNSLFQGPGGTSIATVSVETDASFGYDWNIRYPRMISFFPRGDVGSNPANLWQFSGNTAVFPHVMPLALDFISAGNVRKLGTNTSSGYEFTQFVKTDNPNGFMNINAGLIRNNFTRAQLLALPANQLIGSIAFCTDATGGAALCYARGTYPTDWVTVVGNVSI